MKTVAILLSAGSGKRMGTETKKQYLEVCGKPLLYFSLEALEKSFIDEVILVTSEEDEEFVRNEILEPYGITKVTKIVYGGKERYHSVAAGLAAVENADYVFIHDGARPNLTADILDRLFDKVKECKAAVAGMPSKDTVKLADSEGVVMDTPDRSRVWMVQTPQVFETSIIKEAYEKLLEKEEELLAKGIKVTDDAMVLELLGNHKVTMVPGSYLNIKVTTPEDLIFVENAHKAV